MTVAIPATTPSTFEIKSAHLPLVALLLKSADLGSLKREMSLRFGDIPDFFDQDPLVIDLAPLVQAQIDARSGTPDVDFHALIALLRNYRLAPIAVKGGNSTQMAAALAAGLVSAPDAQPSGSKTNGSSKKQTALLDTTSAGAPSPAPVAPPPAAPLNALIVDKQLRSGQQVYARGRDLVVLAMVNAGAEVIADGHIHVYAPLRGKAMAGARGNADARIFALAMEAELLSIAGVYRTSEHPLPASVQGKPTQVRLLATPDGGKLMMDRM